MPHVTATVTGALSSGQLSRLHLCKAFINDPDILFLDEPTASLDPDIAVKVRATLRQMQRERGVTIIYTSHNMREIEHMCDEVLFLARGQAVTQGSPSEVIARTRTASLEEVFISIARDGRVQDIAEARESD
jgi:ABC-2 type transport system ATP-binding protein